MRGLPWLIGLGLFIALVGYGAVMRRPATFTMDQCRDLARNSDEVRQHIRAHAQHADEQDVIEAAATECVVDHAADTANLPLQRRVQIAAERFCAAKALRAIPGDDSNAKSARDRQARICTDEFVDSALGK